MSTADDPGRCPGLMNFTPLGCGDTARLGREPVLPCLRCSVLSPTATWVVFAPANKLVSTQVVPCWTRTASVWLRWRPSPGRCPGLMNCRPFRAGSRRRSTGLRSSAPTGQPFISLGQRPRCLAPQQPTPLRVQQSKTWDMLRQTRETTTPRSRRQPHGRWASSSAR
jgi:hypothetical protein